jgi:branched-chain amino acid transport system ATP-binding protein
MSEPNVLEVSDLRAGYGPIEVLHGLELVVGQQEIAVVLGANGAGKTTMMRAISGAIVRHGTILMEGKPTERLGPDAIVRLGIALVPQGRGTFTDLSVEDNLRVGGYLRSKDLIDEDLERWYGVFPRLRDRRAQKAGSLSGGEQQMLAIARALMSRPRLLLCDEPSLGLAPIIVQEMFNILYQLNQENGMAILLVEQNASLAMKLAHRVYLLETGNIVATGDAETMQADDSVRKAYLGY